MFKNKIKNKIQELKIRQDYICDILNISTLDLHNFLSSKGDLEDSIIERLEILLKEFKIFSDGLSEAILNKIQNKIEDEEVKKDKTKNKSKGKSSKNKK